MLKRLDNVGIAVRDIRRALAFYTQTLGLVPAQIGETDSMLTLHGGSSPMGSQANRLMG